MPTPATPTWEGLVEGLEEEGTGEMGVQEEEAVAQAMDFPGERGVMEAVDGWGPWMTFGDLSVEVEDAANPSKLLQ
jgi:hypothetical protein